MFKKYAGAYVINLLENDDRRENFIKAWNNRSPKIEVIEAIDTRLGWWKKYKNFMSENAIKQMKQTTTNKFRETHADLTPGAIGCYLSHLKCWEKFLQSKKGDYCLVLEDDSSLPNNLLPMVNKISKNINEKWGFVLLGWIAYSQYQEYNDLVCKVDRFQLLHAYLISRFGAKKALSLHDKIEYQIDHFLSNVSKECKIFGLNEDLCKQENTCGYTNIQNFIVKNI